MQPSIIKRSWPGPESNNIISAKISGMLNVVSTGGKGTAFPDDLTDSRSLSKVHFKDACFGKAIKTLLLSLQLTEVMTAIVVAEISLILSFTSVTVFHALNASMLPL